MKLKEKLITFFGREIGAERNGSAPPADKEADPKGFATSQIVYRYGLTTPFDAYWDKYQPTKRVLSLYDAIREAIPLADVAIRTRARMLTGVRLDGLGNPRVQKALDEIAAIRVGWFQRGIDTLIEGVSDAALHKGYDVFEIVPEIDNRSVSRAVIGLPDNFRVNAEERTGPVIEQEVAPGRYERLPRPDLLFMQIFGTSAGGYYGRPVFASCPFIAKIVTRILTAVDTVIWRFADPTILSVLKGGTAADLDLVGAAATEYGAELSKAMATRKSGGVYDVQVGIPEGGEFKVILLGADAKPMDIAVDYKLALEQIISASELPPWKFGLSWSTTERLSTNQNEAALAVVEGNRKAFEPNLVKLVDMCLMFYGLTGAKWRFEWLPVNLTDEVAKADARLKNADAELKEIQAAQSLLDTGIMDEEEYLSFAVERGFVDEKTLKGSTEARVQNVKMRAKVKRAEALARASLIGTEF